MPDDMSEMDFTRMWAGTDAPVERYPHIVVNDSVEATVQHPEDEPWTPVECHVTEMARDEALRTMSFPEPGKYIVTLADSTYYIEPLMD